MCCSFDRVIQEHWCTFMSWNLQQLHKINKHPHHGVWEGSSYTWIPYWTAFDCGQISIETATHSLVSKPITKIGGAPVTGTSVLFFTRFQVLFPWCFPIMTIETVPSNNRTSFPGNPEKSKLCNIGEVSTFPDFCFHGKEIILLSFR